MCPVDMRMCTALLNLTYFSLSDLLNFSTKELLEDKWHLVMLHSETIEIRNQNLPF